MKVKHTKNSKWFVSVFTEGTESKDIIHVIGMSTKKLLFKVLKEKILKALKSYHTVYINKDSPNEVFIYLEKDYEFSPEYLKYGDYGSRYYDIVQHTVSKQTSRHIETILSRRKNKTYCGKRAKNFPKL